MEPIISLPIGIYRFHFDVRGTLQFPSQPGVLWHSVFGKALREQVCITKSNDCENCLFLQQCDYTHLFRGAKPADSQLMRKYQTIPSPHILRSPFGQPTVFKSGDKVALEVVLVGNANGRLPVLISALQRAGMTGLGKLRICLQLLEVEQVSPVSGEVGKLFPSSAGGSVADLLVGPISVPMVVTSVPVTFEVPYKPSGTSGQLEVGRWLMAVIRRIDLLQYFTTGQKLMVDFRFLKELTEQVSVSELNLKLQRGGRYSSGAGYSKDVSGFIGSFKLDLHGCEALWPFLWVGQWLHVGKNASMGFGRYRLGRH